MNRKAVMTHMEIKDVKFGKTERKSYAKYQEILQMPNLLKIQKDSYNWFLNEGLREVFHDSVRPAVPTILTPIGKIVEDCILSLPLHNHGIRLDKYVVMPNHIHLLLRFVPSVGGQSRPPLQKVMQSLKSVTTRKCWQFGVSKLWQRSFYDHVIRNETDYLKIWQYIEENPLRWSEDVFFEPADS